MNVREWVKQACVVKSTGTYHYSSRAIYFFFFWFPPHTLFCSFVLCAFSFSWDLLCIISLYSALDCSTSSSLVCFIPHCFYSVPLQQLFPYFSYLSFPHFILGQAQRGSLLSCTVLALTQPTLHYSTDYLGPHYARLHTRAPLTDPNAFIFL